MKQLLLPLLLGSVTGCSTPANPPSLLPRAIEMRPEATAITPQPITPKPLSAATRATLSALVAEARAGDADFAKAERSGGATIIASRSSPPGGEAWIAAELVRSALQVSRQRSAGALAEIDSLAVFQGELAMRDPSAGGLAEIQAAQREVEILVARQTSRIDNLSH